jgi:hypothetical protein
VDRVVDEREKEKGTEEFFVHDWNEGETFGAEIRRGERGEAGKGGRVGKEKTRQLHHRRFHQLGIPALSHPNFEAVSRTSPVPCTQNADYRPRKIPRACLFPVNTEYEARSTQHGREEPLQMRAMVQREKQQPRGFACHSLAARRAHSFPGFPHRIPDGRPLAWRSS